MYTESETSLHKPDEERSVDPAGEKIFRCIARDWTVVPARQHDEGDLGDDDDHDGDDDDKAATIGQ